MLQQEGFRDDRPDSTRPEEPDQRGQHLHEEKKEVSHGRATVLAPTKNDKTANRQTGFWRELRIRQAQVRPAFQTDTRAPGSALSGGGRSEQKQIGDEPTVPVSSASK